MPRRNEEGEGSPKTTQQGMERFLGGKMVGALVTLEAGHSCPFLSPELTILLVCAKDRDLWPLPVSEHAQNTRSIFFSQTDLSDLMMSQ